MSGRRFSVHSIGGAKRILGSSSKTCNEAVRGDMDLETLKNKDGGTS